MVPKKLPGASGGKANAKDTENWQNWDLKQDIRCLEEGIDDEQKHFEEWLMKEAEFCEESHREAEAMLPNKIKPPASEV